MSGGGIMSKQRDNKGFWNSYAKLYDFEINRFSGKAYAEMYRMRVYVIKGVIQTLLYNVQPPHLRQ